MKKLLSFLLVLAMLFSLAACGAGNGPVETDPPTPNENKNPGNANDGEAAGSEDDEEAIMMAQWHQGIGIDTVFENPWLDLQSLIPFMLYDSLIVQNADGTYENKLASNYSVSGDGKTYTFTIREDAVWSDGTPVTTEDIVWSLNACVGSASSYCAPLGKILGYADVASGKATEMSGISVEGNNVILNLASPDRGLLYGLAVVKILPAHLLKNVAYADITTYEPFWSNPVTCGQYVIEEVSFPDYVILTANAKYYGEQPGIPKVLFTNYAAGGNDAVVAALIAGNLDFAWKNALNDIEVANNVTSQNSDITAQLVPSFYTRSFAFNCSYRADGKLKEDLKNPVVRQAFDMIFDKNAIASFYTGQAVGLSTFVNPVSDLYNDDIPLPEQDIDGAVALLKSVNYDFSQVIDICHYYDDQTTLDVMALIKQDFAKAGITVETHLLTGDLNALLNVDRNYDLSYGGDSGAVDPLTMYESQLSTNANTIGLEEERAKAIDPFYDAYITCMDDADAKEAGDALQVAAREAAFKIPAYSLNSMYYYNSSRVSIPEPIFEIDSETGRNWLFEDWSLIG
ncbi:MAG: hypothetical protein IJO31_06555 [Oscillospiraceae bacterium]|nr:hypothetical protein [Oscillospiraceae bacterium]